MHHDGFCFNRFSNKINKKKKNSMMHRKHSLSLFLQYDIQMYNFTNEAYMYYENCFFFKIIFNWSYFYLQVCLFAKNQTFLFFTAFGFPKRAVSIYRKNKRRANVNLKEILISFYTSKDNQNYMKLIQCIVFSKRNKHFYFLEVIKTNYI